MLWVRKCWYRIFSSKLCSSKASGFPRRERTFGNLSRGKTPFAFQNSAASPFSQQYSFLRKSRTVHTATSQEKFSWPSYLISLKTTGKRIYINQLWFASSLFEKCPRRTQNEREINGETMVKTAFIEQWIHFNIRHRLKLLEDLWLQRSILMLQAVAQ